MNIRQFTFGHFGFGICLRDVLISTKYSHFKIKLELKNQFIQLKVYLGEIYLSFIYKLNRVQTIKLNVYFQ